MRPICWKTKNCNVHISEPRKGLNMREMSNSGVRPYRRVVAALGVVPLTAVLAACGGSGGGGGGAEGEEIRIGQLLPLSGPLADLGTRVSRGAEIARQLANEEPCIEGAEFVWETVDAPDDQAARQGAERLVNDGIEIVYGTYGSSLALAASPVVARAGGVYWEEGATAEELTSQGVDGIFRVSATASTLGVDAVDFAAEVVAEQLGVDPSELTVAWAGVNTSYGTDVLAGVQRAAEEHGMEIVLEAAYPTDATDLSSVALQVRDAAPDVLVLTNYPTDGAALGRALRAADVQPQAIIGTGGAHADPSWVEAMGPSGNGFFNVGTSPELDVSGLSEEAQARQEDYVAAFQEEFGEEPAGFDRMGFDGAWTLFETICEAGSADPAEVKAAAMEMELPERSLLNGDGLQFNENGQNERVSWMISQWQDGALVPVAPADLGLAEPSMIPLPPWAER
jgi:branched-chain amino acid transport system substrate-binding protein